MEVCRRLIVLIPYSMIELVEEKRPRALMVLAQYFVMTAPLAKVATVGLWVSEFNNKVIALMA